MGAEEQGAHLTAGRWLTVSRTLSFVRCGDEVLLLRRAAHKRIFPNRYNGVGGHVERGEDVLTSARREIQEETGLDVPDLTLRAVYSVDAGAETGITVYVFTGATTSRDVIDSDEGTLEWVPVADVLSRDLVDDLRLLLPRFLAMLPDAPPLFLSMDYDADGALRIHGLASE